MKREKIEKLDMVSAALRGAGCQSCTSSFLKGENVNVKSAPRLELFTLDICVGFCICFWVVLALCWTVLFLAFVLHISHL